MEVFDLTRGTTTGTVRVPAKAGATAQCKIRSIKTRKVNGKPQTPERIAFTYSYVNQGMVRASWKEDPSDSELYIVELLVINANITASERTTTMPFTQNESGNILNLTVTQEAGVTYTGYIEMVSNSLPLGGSKGNTAQILVMAYLKGSDGSKKPETPHVGNAPDWCAVSVAPGVILDHYRLSLIALSDNNTGANRSGYLFLTCGDAKVSIPVTQNPQRASTFTLSGLPTDTTGYYLFGKGARPQITSSSNWSYIQGTSATGTVTMKIPFYANDSEPGSRIECTIGDRVDVYTKPGATWILKGSFIVPSAGGTVSI